MGRGRHRAAGPVGSVARRLTCDALALADGKDAPPRSTSPARRGESAARVSNALTLASEAGIVVTPDDVDADPFLLDCPNGVLDLRTGQTAPCCPGGETRRGITNCTARRQQQR